MLPPLSRRFVALEGRRSVFVAELARLSPAQRAYQPPGGGWSIPMVAEHLWFVDRGVVDALRSGQTIRNRRLKDLPRYALVWAVLVFGIRVRVPVRGVDPSREPDLEALPKAWDATRAELRGWLSGLDRTDLRRRVFRHPVAGPMTPAQTLDFLRRHWDHHLHQIRRIRKSPTFPG